VRNAALLKAQVLADELARPPMWGVRDLYTESQREDMEAKRSGLLAFAQVPPKVASRVTSDVAAKGLQSSSEVNQTIVSQFVGGAVGGVVVSAGFVHG
jgi:hypothetical protein